MTINYNLVIVVMLFIVLMSIQFTLNKIYVLLKEIKKILNLKKLRINNYDNSKKYIKDEIQKIAEAIEAVLEIDVTIVDENLVELLELVYM